MPQSIPFFSYPIHQYVRKYSEIWYNSGVKTYGKTYDSDKGGTFDMWLLFAVSTTLIWGIAEFFYKKGANENEDYAHLKINVCVGIPMGLHALYTILTKDIGFLPVNLIRYFPVSACYILSMTMSFFGIRYIEESIADPIENTSGALCALFCVIFLHEPLTAVHAAAILLIVTGILGVGFLENSGSTDRKKKLGAKMAVIAFMMPFGYALFDAIGSFLDVFYLDMETTLLMGVTEETIELCANTAYELTYAICALGTLVFLKVKDIRFGLKGQRDKIIAGVCETAGQLTYVFAMSGNGAVAAPIISSSCVMSLLLSRLFLKEKLTGKQYTFIALVLAGILLLAAAEG